MHNCVDLDRINRVVAQTVRDARPRAFPSGGLVVGCVTRLHREKGVDVLLEAFPGVVALVPSARLLIVGDGPDRELLRARSGELGLSHRIIWAGRQMWKQAIELADQMDIVVVPSRFEGFGLSAIEAMALSKPVVAANVGGLAEVIGDEGCGMLVPPENPRALTETIVSLWRNPEQRLAVANAARHRVEARFSFQRYRQDVLVLYSDLLATSDVNAFASPSGALS